MKEVKIGEEFKVEKIVTKDMLASEVGSGEANVLATPMMVTLMENAAMKCLSQFLEEENDESSVGTYIQTTHDSATPLGMKIYAIAKITECDRRRVEFNIEAYDKSGIIGKAKHTRFVIYKTRFQEKADAKA